MALLKSTIVYLLLVMPKKLTILFISACCGIYSLCGKHSVSCADSFRSCVFYLLFAALPLNGLYRQE